MTSTGTTLTIYTMSHCPTSEDTCRVARIIRERVPGLRVELVNLDDPGIPIPPEVFSVPTYILNGQVISLGNPYIEQLEATVRAFARG